MDISSKDFEKAYYKLLPPGEYWSTENQGETDLKNLIEGLSIEAESTQKDITALLYKADNIKQGWKLSDYQSLLNQRLLDARVYDIKSDPHRIYIDYKPSSRSGETMQYLEDYRLAHTVFGWCPHYDQKISTAAANATKSVSRRALSTDNNAQQQGQTLIAMARCQIVITKKIEKVI